MNKQVKVAVIITAIVIAIIAIIVVCCLVFIKDKIPITAEEFKTKMEEKGYTVKDATYQYESYGEYEKVYIAIDSESKYQIKFYQVIDTDTAQNFFNSNKQVFENSKEDMSSSSSTSLKNYSKYTLQTNGKYKIISRIEDTVIYLNVNDTYKDTIKSILKDLGY